MLPEGRGMAGLVGLVHAWEREREAVLNNWYQVLHPFCDQVSSLFQRRLGGLRWGGVPQSSG